MKTAQKILIGALVGGALFAGVGVLVLTGGEEEAIASEVPVGKRLRAALPFVRSAEPCDFDLGRRASWSYQLKATTNLGGLLSAQGSVEVPAGTSEVSAVLSAEVLEKKGERAIFLARLTHVDGETRARHGSALESAFLLEVDQRCALTNFARAKSTPLAVARVQQVTLSQLWFKVPVEEQDHAEAQDGVGVFDALLVGGKDVNGAFVQRRIQEYRRTWGRNLGAVTVEDSFQDVRLGGTLWFKELNGVQSVATQNVGTGRAEYRLRQEPVRDGFLDGNSRNEADYVWENLLPRSELQPVAKSERFTPEERRQHAALKNVSYEAALDSFTQKLELGESVNEQWPTMARYLEAHPEAIPGYAESLRGEDFPSNVRGTAYLALGKARVPEARDALMTLAQDESVIALNRHRATFALVEREDVGVELARFLRQETQKLASPNRAESFSARNSALALGMMIGVRERDSETKAEAAQAVRAMLGVSTSAEALSPAFGAIGNTGDASYLSLLEPYSRHEDPEIRAAATKGFRRLKPEQSEEWVVTWLSRETSPDVKRELFHVIHHQHLDAQQNVSESIARLAATHLKQQPYVLTRQSLVRILGPLCNVYPFAKQALLNQVKFEWNTESGLYDLISQYVHGDEVSRSLHELPEFATDVAALGPTHSLSQTVTP